MAPDAQKKVVLGTLFAGAFTIGSAEMLPIGMLPLLAADLGESLEAIGALVTANALGLAIGGPLATLAATRLDRRTALIISTAGFLVFIVVPLLVPSYPLFLAARVMAGSMQGLFIAAAITTATSIVPPERAGRAMAVVISGFASASALGLPLGTLLGQAVGWRGAFLAVAALGSVVLISLIAAAPRVPTVVRRALGQARFALAPRVLAVLALCALIFTGIQTVLTYLVPHLTTVSGVAAPVVSIFLLAYGVATTVGSIAGGRFADAYASLTLVVGSIGLCVTLVVFWIFGASPIVAGACVIALGLFGMGMTPSMQHRVVELAGAGAPLASSLPSSAVNLGIAGGALLGGATISVGGVDSTPLTGALIAGGAVVVAVACLRLPAPLSIPPTTPAISKEHA